MINYFNFSTSIGWIAILYVVNILLIFAVIFTERKSPSATLAWVMVLAFIPIVGFVFYIVFNQIIFSIGQYTFDYPRQTLQISDQTETLSHREAEILRMLCQHTNDVLHRKPVLLELWGDDSFFNARSMDVFITKLRKKLKADPSVQIVNIRGIGYKLII